MSKAYHLICVLQHFLVTRVLRKLMVSSTKTHSYFTSRTNDDPSMSCIYIHRNCATVSVQPNRIPPPSDLGSVPWCISWSSVLSFCQFFMQNVVCFRLHKSESCLSLFWFTCFKSSMRIIKPLWTCILYAWLKYCFTYFRSGVKSLTIVNQILTILPACFSIGEMLSDWQIICCAGPTGRERDRHQGMMGERGRAGVQSGRDGWHSVLPGDPAVTAVPATPQCSLCVWLLSVWLGSSASKNPWGRKWIVTAPSHSIALSQSASSCQSHLVHLLRSLSLLHRNLLSHSLYPFLAMDPFSSFQCFTCNAVSTVWYLFLLNNLPGKGLINELLVLGTLL